MDKNLRIKDIGSILNDYEKITALLRIEKCGRDGLFSLRLFKMNKLANDFKVVLQSKDNPSLYVTAIMNTKSLSNVSLKELSELNGIIDINGVVVIPIMKAIIPGNNEMNVSGVKALCASLNVFEVDAIAIQSPLMKNE